MPSLPTASLPGSGPFNSQTPSTCAHHLPQMLHGRLCLGCRGEVAQLGPAARASGGGRHDGEKKQQEEPHEGMR